PPNQIPVNALPGAIQIMPGNGQIQIQQIQIQVQGGVARQVAYSGDGTGLPALTDARGRAYKLVNTPQRILRGGFGGAVNQEITLVFRADNGQGEPARFVLSGRRPVTVQVPFTLQNVPLP